jgi:N-acetylmuramoyl-L-alanine amidase
MDDPLAALTAAQALALTAYGEARGLPVMGIAAVIAVVHNRVRDGRWGHSIQAVVFARAQFSCWNPSDPNRAVLEHVAEQLRTTGPPPADLPLRACLWLAGEAIPDPTHGATHYFNPNGVTRTPAWAAPPAERTATIGGHVFYRHVR